MNLWVRIANFIERSRLQRMANQAFLRMMKIEEALSDKCMMRDYNRTVIFFKCPFCDSENITISYDDIEDYDIDNIRILCPVCEKEIFSKRAFTSYFNSRKIYHEWLSSSLNPAREKSTLEGPPISLKKAI
jgi:hypothetical protein